VPVGGGVILPDQSIVVTQPQAGEFKAFSAICTHQGCLVADVSNNVISCPCHGAQFSAVDGSVVQGPAQQPLAAAGVVVDNGSVILNG
jgi:Rieske Fe-S protein